MRGVISELFQLKKKSVSHCHLTSPHYSFGLVERSLSTLVDRKSKYTSPAEIKVVLETGDKVPLWEIKEAVTFNEANVIHSELY